MWPHTGYHDSKHSHSIIRTVPGTLRKDGGDFPFFLLHILLLLYYF